MNIGILDIETTNFLNRGGFIVEIGIADLNLETGETKIVYDQMVWETGITQQLVEDSWIVKNSSMTLKDFKGSKNLNDIKDEVQEIIDDYVLGVTAFNNAFDFEFMEDRGFMFHVKLPCPMKIATPILKLPKSVKAKKAGFGKGYKWPSVQETYDFLFPDNDYVEQHRGADDALHEAKIVYELYKRGDFVVPLLK